MSKQLKLKTPAKINLFLEILNKRSDGYHNLVSIMQTVTLFDELTIESLSNDAIEIESNNKEIPTDSRNLVYKAVKAIKEQFNIKQGVKIYINKQIPMGAGLGGGSSNAAGTIKGLIKLWNIMPLDEISKNEQIRLLSSKLGADVPFFLTGQTALCEGIGDIVAPIKSIGKKNVILINPNFSVSTAGVYKRIKFPLTKISQMYKIPTDFKHWSLDKNNLFNRLEEFVFPYNPEIAKIKSILIQAECLALMSGSGSTVFGISKSKEHSDETIKKLNKYNWKIYNTKTC